MKKTASDIFLSVWYGDRSRFLFLLILLWPLSLLFRSIACIRRQILQVSQARLPVPVVVVGNITVGGTGKTPLICYLATSMQARGVRVGIISRGYGGSHTGQPRLLQAGDDAAAVGDEPLLLAKRTDCPVVIAQDRLAAAIFLYEKVGVDVILSDDGLQHYRLPRTLEIAVLDGSRGIGNGFCLPAGPLREPVARLEEVDFVVVNGAAAKPFRDDQISLHVQPGYFRNLRDGNRIALNFFPSGTRVHAVAGIGNPDRFFHSLRTIGLDVIEHAFPDHHVFSESELLFGDGLPLVMTEKDEMKCRDFALPQTYSLIVDAVVDETLLMSIIRKLSAKN